MAYAALVSLSQLLDHTLHHDHKYFYVPRGDDRRNLQLIHESSSSLQAFLDDYSHKGGETVKSLEVKIRDAAYRAQDIIEWQISNHIGRFYHDDGVKKSCCQSVLSLTRKKKLQLGAHLLEAFDLLVLILDETVNIRISCSVEESQISSAQTPALASSSEAGSSKNEMVGYEDDLIANQERLCGESSRLKIIPIVGMGGIGKTTLARNLFHDSLIAYHFHTCAWATISQQHRPKEILLGILHSLTLKREGEIRTSYLHERSSEESLKESVYRSLKGKRYLIVLDDMWDDLSSNH